MDNRDKIIDFVKVKGPVLPIQISKLIGMDMVMASAHLAELTGYSASQALLRFHPLALQENLAPLFGLLETLPDLAARHIYLCGPPPLVDAITRQLCLRGVSQRQIHFESFDFR